MEIGVEGRPHPPPRRPDDVGIDLSPDRRPGVPRNRKPEPLQNAQFPPQRMTAPPSSFKHGRPNKQMPPVWGTAVPPRGLSGRIRAAAYRYPDHVARHWTMLLFADRVDSWEYRVRKLAKLGVPAAGLVLAGAFALVARQQSRPAPDRWAVARVRTG
jgi:hypothetical protein